MARGRIDSGFEPYRRDFLLTAGGALTGVDAVGVIAQATTGKRHAQRGGVLLYGSCPDVASLDAHRHNMKNQSAKFNTWQWQVGDSYIVFNWRGETSQDKRLRTAVVHAIDRAASHYSVY
jgi:ABC-type transport system substrate-binding protein